MQRRTLQLTSQRRALGSLLAVGLVLLVCWGQLLSVTVCPLQAVAQAQTADDARAAEAGDCELSSQLLNFHSFAFDIGLPVSLALLWMLLWLTRRLGWGKLFTEPITPKRRRHLYFCVFLE